MKYKDLIKILQEDGWKIVRTVGYHQQFKHDTKKGTVTVPFHGKNKDIPCKTLKSIMKQAELL